MAAPAYGTNTQSAFATAADITATEPASASSNDILIAWLYREDVVNGVTPPAGWSNSFNGTTMQIDCTSAAVDFRMIAYWIRRGGSAPSLTWTFASCFRSIRVARYTGAVTSGDPFSFGAVAARDNSTNRTWPAVSGTTLTTNELLIWCGIGEDLGGAGTPPTGYTERIDASVWTELADLAQAVAGGTGSVSGALYAGGLAAPTTLCFCGLCSLAKFIAAKPLPIRQAVNRAGTY